MKLQSFLYTLMRDEVVPGAIEKIVQDIEGAETRGVKEFYFSNKHLAALREGT